MLVLVFGMINCDLAALSFKVFNISSYTFYPLLGFIKQEGFLILFGCVLTEG
jgi:hypothetical protein